MVITGHTEKRQVKMSDTLFLFSHYGSWDWVYQNFNALVECEGVDNVIPISEDDHGLPGTCVLRKYGYLFGFDDHNKHLFCDAMLYHWVLHNEQVVAEKKLIFLVESDVFWGIPSSSWRGEIPDHKNIAMACGFIRPGQAWIWFPPYENHRYYKQMVGMIIGSIVAFDAKCLLKMARRFRDDKELWDIGLNELRMGTIANMCGAEFFSLPKEVCKMNHWGLWAIHEYKGEGIFHPVKYTDKTLKTRIRQ